MELGYLREPDLRAALALQAEKPERKLGEILIDCNFIKEDKLSAALSFQLGYELLSPSELMPDPDFFRAAPVNWFRSRDCIPLTRRDGAVLVAFSDPRDRQHVEAVARLLGNRIIVGIAGNTEIHHALNKIESVKEKRAAIGISENSVVQAVNELINVAADTSISDIHIEPGKKSLRIRFRKDGALAVHKEHSLEMVGPLTNRIKIMASIDISEKRRHQDGRILYDYRGNPLDICVSTYGTIYGEAIVMRLLNNRDQLLDIRDIGMAPPVVNRYIEDALDSPSGELPFLLRSVPNSDDPKCHCAPRPSTGAATDGS